MFDRNTTHDVLTDEQLEFVSGGVTVDATGNIPTCPPLPPTLQQLLPHNPDAPIWN